MISIYKLTAPLWLFALISACNATANPSKNPTNESVQVVKASTFTAILQPLKGQRQALPWSRFESGYRVTSPLGRRMAQKMSLSFELPTMDLSKYRFAQLTIEAQKSQFGNVQIKTLQECGSDALLEQDVINSVSKSWNNTENHKVYEIPLNALSLQSKERGQKVCFELGVQVSALDRPASFELKSSKLTFK